MRVAGKKGKCLFIDYDRNSFSADGVMGEFGQLSKELLLKLGVDINFGGRSKLFIEEVLTMTGVEADVKESRYDRMGEGDYKEVVGQLGTLDT